MKSEDKRHMDNNEGRKTSCPSNKVEDTKDVNFWVPPLNVFDDIEMVDHVMYI